MQILSGFGFSAGLTVGMIMGAALFTGNAMRVLPAVAWRGNPLGTRGNPVGGFLLALGIAFGHGALRREA